MFAYLAHPIDQADSSSWLGSLLVDVRRLFAAAGIGAFQPGQAYVANPGNPTHAKRVNDLNIVAIHQADVLVAVLPAGMVTLGTPVEIGLALHMRKPVLIFTDITASVQLSAWVERGAQVVNIDDDELPVAKVLLDLIDLSATAVRWWADQHSVPTQPEPPFTFELEQVSHQPLLVSGAAANLRQRAYPGDAGLDLTLSHGLVLFDQHYTMAGTGVHVAIPEGYWGLITGRSSTWAKYRCDVRQAVIDSGYRGELMVGIENRSGQSVEFAAGTRLAQLVLLPIWPGEVVPVETLPDHERGHNGYGSSDDRTEQLPAVS